MAVGKGIGPCAKGKERTVFRDAAGARVGEAAGPGGSRFDVEEVDQRRCIDNWLLRHQEHARSLLLHSLALTPTTLGNENKAVADVDHAAYRPSYVAHQGGPQRSCAGTPKDACASLRALAAAQIVISAPDHLVAIPREISQAEQRARIGHGANLHHRIEALGDVVPVVAVIGSDPDVRLLRIVARGQPPFSRMAGPCLEKMKMTHVARCISNVPSPPAV